MDKEKVLAVLRRAGFEISEDILNNTSEKAFDMKSFMETAPIKY